MWSKEDKKGCRSEGGRRRNQGNTSNKYPKPKGPGRDKNLGFKSKDYPSGTRRWNKIALNSEIGHIHEIPQRHKDVVNGIKSGSDNSFTLYSAAKINTGLSRKAWKTMGYWASSKSTRLHWVWHWSCGLWTFLLQQRHRRGAGSASGFTPVLLLFLLVPIIVSMWLSCQQEASWPVAHTLQNSASHSRGSLAPIITGIPASDFLASFPNTLPAILNCGTSSKFLYPVSHTTLSSESQLWGRRERALSQVCSFLGGSLSLPVMAAPYICYSGIL